MGKKKEAIRVVLDTNVVVSALFFGGRLSVIRTAWREARITPVLSLDTFHELVNVLGYPKFSLSKEDGLFPKPVHRVTGGTFGTSCLHLPAFSPILLMVAGTRGTALKIQKICLTPAPPLRGCAGGIEERVGRKP